MEGEDSLYMVMEYCPGGSLMRLVQETRQMKIRQQCLDQKEHSTLLNAGLDLDFARKYFRQLVAGIDYLHRNEIIRQSNTIFLELLIHVIYLFIFDSVFIFEMSKITTSNPIISFFPRTKSNSRLSISAFRPCSPSREMTAPFPAPSAVRPS